MKPGNLEYQLVGMKQGAKSCGESRKMRGSKDA